MHHLLRLLPELLLLSVGACVTASNVPPEVAATIPREARAIRIYSTESPRDYYGIVYRSLAARGFAITQANDAMGSFSTDFKEIGQETTLKISVFIQADIAGSVATLRGQWGVTASMAAGLSAGFGVSVAGGGAEDARWGSSGRPKAAFGEMAVIASAIPHTRIEYPAQ